MSWTGGAAAAGALDGKIVDSELGEVFIGGRYLSVNKRVRHIDCPLRELYHVFLDAHVPLRNISVLGRKLSAIG